MIIWLGDLIMAIMLLIGVLVGVAFLTLFERKILGYIQCRKGPLIVGVGGFLQPFSDALSLMLKGGVKGLYFNYFIYMLSPMLGMLLALMMWLVYPILVWNLWDFSLGLLFFFVCSSLGVYGLMMAGWGSNSKFGLLGAYRAVAQTISYEVSMIMILLVLVFMSGFYDIVKMDGSGVLVFVGWLILFVMWSVTCVAELNRTPFDFAEGESELVSGFNVEYSGGVFALIFITEYANILLMSMISVLFFWGFSWLVVKVLMFGFFIVWLRGVLVRYRYDKMMMLIWSSLLPLVMSVLIYGVVFLNFDWF